MAAIEDDSKLYLSGIEIAAHHRLHTEQAYSKLYLSGIEMSITTAVAFLPLPPNCTLVELKYGVPYLLVTIILASKLYLSGIEILPILLLPIDSRAPNCTLVELKSSICSLYSSRQSILQIVP